MSLFLSILKEILDNLSRDMGFFFHCVKVGMFLVSMYVRSFLLFCRACYSQQLIGRRGQRNGKFHRCCNTPEELERAQEELDVVLGRERVLDESDLPNGKIDHGRQILVCQT